VAESGVDTSGLIDHQARFFSALQPQWRAFGNEIQKIVREVILSQMAPAGEGFNTGGKLRNQTGATVDSFKATVETNADGVAVTMASDAPWIGIQEEGGFIKSKGSMHEYAWAMYYKTNEPRYKWIALSIIKNGGVTIKGTHTVENAAKALEQRSAEIGEQVMEIVGLTWMRTS
jgi:hypothetical protein